MSKTILITGASSGFGEMTAYALADAGYTVFVSMRDTAGRNAPKVAQALDYSRKNRVDLRSIELDVTNHNSVDAVAEIIRQVGCIDVVGAQRVNRAALPHMRRTVRVC